MNQTATQRAREERPYRIVYVTGPMPCPRCGGRSLVTSTRRYLRYYKCRKCLHCFSKARLD